MTNYNEKLNSILELIAKNRKDLLEIKQKQIFLETEIKNLQQTLHPTIKFQNKLLSFLTVFSKI